MGAVKIIEKKKQKHFLRFFLSGARGFKKIFFLPKSSDSSIEFFCNDEPSDSTVLGQLAKIFDRNVVWVEKNGEMWARQDISYGPGTVCRGLRVGGLIFLATAAWRFVLVLVRCSHPRAQNRTTALRTISLLLFRSRLDRVDNRSLRKKKRN